MKELLKLDGSGNQAVSARELHFRLGVGRDFSTWIKDRIEKYGFVEGRDYQKSQSPNLGTGNLEHTGGSPMVNYLLTLSMAKEIAIVENNEQGRAIRQYLTLSRSRKPGMNPPWLWPVRSNSRISR